MNGAGNEQSVRGLQVGNRAGWKWRKHRRWTNGKKTDNSISVCGCCGGLGDDRLQHGGRRGRRRTDEWKAAGTKRGKQQRAVPSVIVTMPPTSEPEAGFDPAYGWGAGEHVHEPLIQSTLTTTTTDLEIGLDLAVDYSVSEDGLLWTVTIRDDVFFTDGEPLTAWDVGVHL